MSDTLFAEVPDPTLDSRVRAFRHGAIVDTFALRTDRYLVLVDTGTRPEALESVLTAVAPDLGARALLAINTHGDWDHVWGNSVLAGADATQAAPIIAHRLAAERAVHPDSEAQLASLRSSHPSVYERVRLCPPTILFEGELRIDAGDLTLHLIPTPGHSPDHIAIWIPEIRYMLAGDAAELPFPVVSHDGSLSEIRASLRRMQALNPDRVLYCHALGRTDPDLLVQNAAYFDELEARCRQADPGIEPEGLGWSLEDALPPGVTMEDIDVDFYRRFHDTNIRAGLMQRHSA